MPNYVKITNFAAKTVANKVTGAEWDAEFVAIQVALGAKQAAPQGQTILTTTTLGTLVGGLFGIGYSAANIPSLLTFGDRPILFATNPTGSNTLDQTANLSNGQCLPIMVAAGSSPAIKAEAGVGIYLTGLRDTQVSLLLHADENDGTFVGKFKDSGAYGLIDSFGVSLTTSVSSKFGARCFAMNGGSTASLACTQAIGGPLDLSDGATSTTELWFYPLDVPDGTPTFYVLLAAWWEGAAGAGFRIQYLSDGTVTCQSFGGWASGDPTSPLASPANLNAWNHVAVVDDGTNINIYLNGIKDTSGRVRGTRTSPAAAGRLSIGADHTSAAQSTWFPGNMDEVAVFKGVVRYTSAFTPPVAAFADATTFGSLAPGSGQTGVMPWADVLRVGGNLYIIPSQHGVAGLTTSLAWVAA